MPEATTIDESGSSNWNVSKGYVHLKILLHLVDIDKLMKISIYGTENLEEAIGLPPQILISNRVQAMNRLLDVLKTLYDNTYFAINRADKEAYERIYKRLLEVEKYIDGISSTKSDQRNGTCFLSINELHFKNTMTELRSIHRDFLPIMNGANLIFRHDEEIDIDKFKKEMIEGG